MRTAGLLNISHGVCGGSAQPLPQMQTPLGADPPGFIPPPQMQTPSEADPPGHVTCDACWEANPSPPLVNRMTYSCKNITLPQISFAGGKK